MTNLTKEQYFFKYEAEYDADAKELLTLKSILRYINTVSAKAEIEEIRNNRKQKIQYFTDQTTKIKYRLIQAISDDFTTEIITISVSYFDKDGCPCGLNDEYLDCSRNLVLSSK